MSVITNIKKRVAGFKSDESGTTMVEYAIVISLFLLILFAVLDFGRLGYSWVMAEKSMQRAARIATVRFPVCPNVPQINFRADPTDTTYLPGASCNAVSGLCSAFTTSCTLDQAVGADSIETVDGQWGIWPAIEPIVPSGVTKSNVLITYEFDQRLGFLGGPFVPIVTAELVGSYNSGTGARTPLYFEFVTPLSSLAGVVGSANASTILPDGTTCTACIPYPDVSSSLPGEDLNQGAEG